MWHAPIYFLGYRPVPARTSHLWSGPARSGLRPFASISGEPGQSVTLALAPHPTRGMVRPFANITDQGRDTPKNGPGPFAANILCGVLKAHKSQLGRYNVSVIVLMEITLFGIALVVFVSALIAMLLSR